VTVQRSLAIKKKYRNFQRKLKTCF